MDDLISRQKTIDAMRELPYGYRGIVWDILNSLPSVQPERKKGHWIDAYPDIEPNPMFMYGICSVCGCEQAISNKLNFCPNCGARMEE